MGFLGVIQFMHPGAEAIVRSDGWTPWNTRDHRRKFLVSPGTSIDVDDTLSQGEKFFWGEWEGPSESVYRWDYESQLPTHLLVPRFPGPARAVPGLQNTDPYVYGEAFKYTLCKQVRRNGRTTFLADLEPGCLILFGSKVQGSFVLDTAFVVAPSTRRLTRSNWQMETADLSTTYRHMTLEPMFWGTDIKDESVLSLYTGCGFESRFMEMFSFVPCMQATMQPTRFRRPSIQIDGVVNPELMMGSKRTKMSLDEIRSTWMNVKSQVQSVGLSLGVQFEEPELTAVPADCWPD